MDGGGGTEFFASQDESHEEDAHDQVKTEEEEEQASGDTYTYTQDARKAVEGPVHPLMPIPTNPRSSLLPRYTTPGPQRVQPLQYRSPRL